MTTFFCILVPALAMFTGHWFPFTKVAGKRPHPILAYIYGTAVIMLTATFAAWYTNGNDANWFEIVRFFWLATVGAGSATIAAWIIDWTVEYIHKLKDRIDRAELSQ